jgi:hypothetical protein
LVIADSDGFEDFCVLCRERLVQDDDKENRCNSWLCQIRDMNKEISPVIAIIISIIIAIPIGLDIIIYFCTLIKKAPLATQEEKDK